MKKLSSIVILLFFNLCATGQGTAFEKKYNPAPRYQVVEGVNNSFYLMSYINTKGTVITHLNAQGDTIWSKAYTCPTCTYSILPPGDFIILKDGNLLFTESYWDIGYPSTWRNFLVKVDTSGNVIWAKSYSSITQNTAIICEGADSSLYLSCGRLLMKTDNYGNFIWSRSLLIANKADIASVNDGIIICGYYSDTTGFKDIMLVKIDPTGNIAWKKRYDGSVVDQAQSIIVSRDSSLLIAGSTFAEGAGWCDAFIMKTDHSGNLLWLKTYGDTTVNQGTGIAETPNGNLLLFGHTYIDPNQTIANVLLIKTDNTGVPYFINSYGDSLNQLGISMFFSPDNTYVISSSKGAIIKMDTTGNIGCLMQNENFTVDSPPFIENTFFPLVDTVIAITTFPVSFVSNYVSVFSQPLCSTLEISEMIPNDSKITIYPNPFSSQTSITFLEDQKNSTIKIIDIIGRELKTINYTGKILVLEKGEMESGIYFVKVIDEKKRVVIKKIIIE